jgi:hypothetical protein
MGEASEMPFRCGGAQNGEKALELVRAAFFEARDFGFGFGLFESLKSLAGLSARDIRFNRFDKSEVPGEGGKARVRWSVSTAAVQVAISAASMISPEPAEGLGPLQAKHGTATHLLALEHDDLESSRPQMSDDGALVTAAGFDADTPDCMLGLAKRREPHGRWDHCQLGGTWPSIAMSSLLMKSPDGL